MKSRISFFKIALIIGLIFNISLLFFTLDKTYDALIHSFFASHYDITWFDPWEPRWYTGFSTFGYPPLLHQVMALIAKVGGLKLALFVACYIIIILFISGVYRYSLLMLGNVQMAGITSLYAGFASFFLETLHVFGQLPTLAGISLLLHSLPSFYLYIRDNKKYELIKGLSLITVTVCTHHVTPIFSMVFFIMPLMAMATYDACLLDMQISDFNSNPRLSLRTYYSKIVSLIPRYAAIMIGIIISAAIFILPYWISSSQDPISQIPIPHGSRDNYFLETNSGFIFFLVPWGATLLLLPYFIYRLLKRRYFFFGLSFLLLILLGTGSTSPIPKLILGDGAFNILTLDRFTFWACVMSLPFFGEFLYRLFFGDIKHKLNEKFGRGVLWFSQQTILASIIFWIVIIISLGYFKPFQPEKINIQPILNFINQDQHYKWRYLMLGFGDQMAWLSANTTAQTIDGNYHSARRLPELTTRAVERLEGAKFKGVEGLGSLQQILTNADVYQLKFIFSNDKFYDPMLYFYGWERLSQLENGIWIWQNVNAPPLSKVQFKKEYPEYQKLMWGILPLTSIIILFLVLLNNNKFNTKNYYELLPRKQSRKINTPFIVFWLTWIVGVIILWNSFFYTQYLVYKLQIDPEHTLLSYYDELDVKNFKESYKYIDPKGGTSYDQYMLDIAVTDGLLNSYGKMNSIDILDVRQGDTTATIKHKISWVTPLKGYEKIYTDELIKRNNKWYIIPQYAEKQKQQNVILSKPSNNFYTHGKRTQLLDENNFDDNLQQPLLDIATSQLVQVNDSEYVVTGQIINIDNYPSGIFIKAELYDEHNQLLASYYAKDRIKHFIYPKECVPFQINFEKIAWTENRQNQTQGFDPLFENKNKFKGKPTKIIIHGSSYLTFKQLYQDVAILNAKIEGNNLTGSVYNTGVKEVTIPQILVSYHKSNGDLIWVEPMYLDMAVKPQKRESFNIPLDLESIRKYKIISNTSYNTYLNGIKDIEDNYNDTQNRIYLNDSSEVNYIKLTVNNFVGNPN